MSSKIFAKNIQPKVFIVSGPSGSGKTTLCKKLLSHKEIKDSLVRSISVTTRARRKGESASADYKFLTQKKFMKMKKLGQLLEWEEVFGAYYGTPKKNVKDVLKKGKSILLCIDVKGAISIKKVFKKAVTIFIMPPSMQVLKKRLGGRSTETAKRLQFRLNKACWEMGFAKKYDYIIVNDRLAVASKALAAIVLAESYKK